MKTRSFLLAAGLALAMAFTFSCSGDGGEEDGGGLNLSDLPKDVYLEGYDEKYGGNGDIAFYFNDDTIPAGKIQNGQLSLTWPDIEGKHLRKIGMPCDDYAERDGTCESTFSAPEVFGVWRSSLYVNNIPDKSYCRLYLYLIKTDQDNRLDFFYISEAGKLNGTSTYTEVDGSTIQWNFLDLNYSKGWFIRYYELYRNGNNSVYNYVDNPSKIGGTLKWRLRCYDD